MLTLMAWHQPLQLLAYGNDVEKTNYALQV